MRKESTLLSSYSLRNKKVNKNEDGEVCKPLMMAYDTGLLSVYGMLIG